MNILTQIFQAPWAIRKDYAQAAYPMVAALMAGKAVEWESPAKEAVVWGIPSGQSQEQRFENYDTMPEGSIATFDLKGPMMKESQFCGPMGTSWLAKQISMADKSEKVSAIILNVDTPGGQVAGTEELSNVIAKAAKPIYALVSRACSAGFWAIAPCEEIWMTGKTAEVGSIGVFCSFTDVRGYWKKKGVKFHEVYSKKSPNKNRSYKEAVEGDYSLLEEELTAIDDIFMSAVQEHRTGIQEEALSGGVYLSEKAISLGMADRIGTMDELIAHIRNQELNQNAMSTEKQGSVISRMLGITTEAEASQLRAEVAELSQREAAANTQVAELQAANTASQARIAELEVQNAALTENLATATQERDEAQSLAEQYGSLPGALGTAPEKQGTEGFKTALPQGFDPNAEHNKAPWIQ